MYNIKQLQLNVPYCTRLDFEPVSDAKIGRSPLEAEDLVVVVCHYDVFFEGKDILSPHEMTAKLTCKESPQTTEELIEVIAAGAAQCLAGIVEHGEFNYLGRTLILTRPGRKEIRYAQTQEVHTLRGVKGVVKPLGWKHVHIEGAPTPLQIARTVSGSYCPNVLTSSSAAAAEQDAMSGRKRGKRKKPTPPKIEISDETAKKMFQAKASFAKVFGR